MLLGPMEVMTMSKTEIMMFYEKQLFSSLHLNILWLSLLYTWECSRNEYLQDNVAPIVEVGLVRQIRCSNLHDCANLRVSLTQVAEIEMMLGAWCVSRSLA